MNEIEKELEEIYDKLIFEHDIPPIFSILKSLVVEIYYVSNSMEMVIKSLSMTIKNQDNLRKNMAKGLLYMLEKLFGKEFWILSEKPSCEELKELGLCNKDEVDEKND